MVRGGSLCLQVGPFVPLPSYTSYLRDVSRKVNLPALFLLRALQYWLVPPPRAFTGAGPHA